MVQTHKNEKNYTEHIYDTMSQNKIDFDNLKAYSTLISEPVLPRAWQEQCIFEEYREKKIDSGKMETTSSITQHAIPNNILTS